MALQRVGGRTRRARAATWNKQESEQIQLPALVLVTLQKDLPVISVFLPEYFGSPYFIKGDLSVLGVRVYVLC